MQFLKIKKGGYTKNTPAAQLPQSFKGVKTQSTFLKFELLKEKHQKLNC